MPSITLGAITLYCEMAGPVAGAPIVLLHGLGSSSADWTFQLPALAARHRVLAPDLRAHGRSSRPRGPLTIDGMAGDVAALLAAVEAPPAHVVGLSLGGCVALALALNHGARVRSLTLVNTFARLVPAGPRGMLRLLARLGLLACAPMSTVAAHVARGLFPRADQQALYRVAVASLGANPRGTYFAAMRAVARFDVRARLGQVRCPTLVVSGARDATVPAAAKDLLCLTIPGAQRLVIADSGHATPADQSALFNTAVLAFVDAH